MAKEIREMEEQSKIKKGPEVGVGKLKQERLSKVSKDLELRSGRNEASHQETGV